MKTQYIISAVAGIVGSIIGVAILGSIATKKIQSMISKPVETAESTDDSAPKTSWIYYTFLGIKAKGARAYTSGTFEIEGTIPTQKDLERARQQTLAANPDFKDCVILSYSQVKDF